MRPITVTMSVTLDGVVQGLGRPDEDTRGGFTLGGWGPRYTDEILTREMGRGMARPGDLLLGRRTWADFAGHWPHQPPNPVTDHLNAAMKYVVSRDLDDAGAWQNSIVLRGEAVHTVRELAAEGDRPLSVIGSASLVRDLHAARLIDGYTLLIHPLTLGAGARLFAEGAPPIEFHLERCVPTSTGVILAEYTRD